MYTSRETTRVKVHTLWKHTPGSSLRVHMEHNTRVCLHVLTSNSREYQVLCYSCKQNTRSLLVNLVNYHTSNDFNTAHIKAQLIILVAPTIEKDG